VSHTPRSPRSKLLAATAVSFSLAMLASNVGQAQSGADLSSRIAAAARVGPSEVNARALEAKTGAMAKVGSALAGLYDQHEAAQRQRAFTLEERALVPVNPMIRMVGDMVIIDAVAAKDTQALLRDLEALGLTHGASFGNVVSGRLPVAALDSLADLDSLQFARPAMAMAQVGAVTSQGDAAMDADQARKEEEVSGRGVTVGVMSDSYDCLGGAAADIASGDLPRASRITILDDMACPGSDEGRGMMQLVRDVAPGASQAFHTAFNGQADFAQGIIELATEARSDIVVDDVIFLAEPMFQDGIIAQAVDTVKDMGVAYFSSAGNGGRSSWESGAGGFVDSGATLGFGPLHDFDPGPGIDFLQTVIVGPGFTTFAFQWDEPAFSVSGPPGSMSDVDIIPLAFPGDPLAAVGGSDFNLGGDPIEVLTVLNFGTEPVPVFLALQLFAGPPPEFMKHVIFDPRVDTIGDPPTSFVVEFPTDSGTNYGHSNAAGAAGVGAAFWRKTPRFGVFPPEIENFSSAGGTPILFDLAGNRIGPEVRDQPRFTGPDGGVTTFFGGRNSFGESDPNGNHFFGTSASAPHAAAVAALMLEANRRLSPDNVYEILEDTAIDMDDPATPGFDLGFDFGTGHGLVDALEAVEEAEDFEDDDDDDDRVASKDDDQR